MQPWRPGTRCTGRPAPVAAPAGRTTSPARRRRCRTPAPSVRKFARELGVPLAEVRVPAPGAASPHEDVQAFTQRVMAAACRPGPAAKAPAGGGDRRRGPGPAALAQVDFAKFSARWSARTWRASRRSAAPTCCATGSMIPHVTNNDEADITELEAFARSTNKENEKSGVKVTMLAFVIKAVVAALKKFPEFNATSLDGDTLVYKQYFHIGFAADTPNGLVVPGAARRRQERHPADQRRDGELAKKARDGKLGAADMQGGLHHLQLAGRHWRHAFHAHHQRAGSGHPGCPRPDEAGVGRQAVQPRLTLPLSLSTTTA